MEKRNIPEIRFKGFSEDWEEEQLSNIYEFSNGINAPKESYGKGRKMVSVLDILRDRNIIYDEIVSSVQLPKEQEETKKLEKGDMVFVRSSEVVEEVGWAKSYNEDKYALFSGFSIRGKKKSNNLSYFIELSLNNKNRKQIENKAGGSTRYNVSQKILREINLLLPELTEQEKIGRLFEKLDQIIDLQGKVVEENKRLKQALLQKLFPRKDQKFPDLRLKGFSGDWEEKKYKELGKILNGYAFKSEDFGLGNIKIIRISNLLSDGFVGGEFVTYKEDDNLKKFIVRDGEILIAMSGATTGKLAINKSDAYLNQRVGAFKPSKNLDNYFLKSYLDRSEFYYFISSNWVAGAQPNISVKQIGEYDMMIPSLPEQEAIGNLFRSLDEKIAREEERLEGYKTLKKSLLQKMFV